MDDRSANNITDDKGNPKTLVHIETLEENFALSNLNVDLISKRSNQEAAGKKKKKRGHTHKHLTIEEEKQYMIYKMITDLFNFEELKARKNFAIKRYKESLYRGEIYD